jgi:hypothetical protein
MHFLHNNKTAYLKVENSAQTILGVFPLGFVVPIEVHRHGIN